MKTLIVGMGNPILTDDAAGLAAARHLEKTVDWADVAYSTVVGFNLLDVLLGYEVVYIIDAMTTPGGEVGQWRKFRQDDDGGTLHLFSSHGVDIYNLMTLGFECGLDMPRLGAVYGIEIGDAVAFGEDLSPPLKERMSVIASGILTDIASELAASAKQ